MLRQNVDETGIHFTVRQYSSRSMMVSTHGVAWVFAPDLGVEFKPGPLGIFPTRTRRKFPLTPLNPRDPVFGPPKAHTTANPKELTSHTKVPDNKAG